MSILLINSHNLLMPFLFIFLFLQLLVFLQQPIDLCNLLIFEFEWQSCFYFSVQVVLTPQEGCVVDKGGNGEAA
jgi:hypothetical protein